MNKESIKLSRNSSGLSGEYFVAAELYRRGFSVGMTIGNAKAVDLFAEINEVTHSVQVKTIFNKKSSGWPIMIKQVKDNVFYVFVNLNGTDFPDYYVLKPQEVRALINDYPEKNRGILQLGKVKNKEEFKNRWDRISS